MPFVKSPADKLVDLGTLFLDRAFESGAVPLGFRLIYVNDLCAAATCLALKLEDAGLSGPPSFRDLSY